MFSGGIKKDQWNKMDEKKKNKLKQNFFKKSLRHLSRFQKIFASYKNHYFVMKNSM